MQQGHTNTGIAAGASAPPKKMSFVIGALTFALAIAATALFAVYSDRLFGGSSNGPAPANAQPSGSVGGSVGTPSQIPTGVATGAPTGAATGIVGIGGVTAAGTMRLQVRVQPIGALVFLDGNLLQMTPQGASVPADGKVHTLRAQATGFASKDVSITLDHDQLVDMGALSRSGGGGTPSHHGAGGGHTGAHDPATPDLGY
ncbi:MAG: hypothetical protein ACREJX_01000 [Polyangiaceae bacterium]